MEGRKQRLENLKEKALGLVTDPQLSGDRRRC